MPIGLTMPLARTTSSLGYLAFSNTELEATYYNLKALLLTDWGERPNHYHLGCNLTEFLFEPADDETRGIVEERIRTQVSKWLPYISIDAVNTNFPREQQLDIQVSFSLRGKQNLSSVVEVSITEAGG